ncbi:MAG: cytochrome b N-terminal domain-containing protein [Ignavibacterium sp.]|jgi:quinol-cytochrome oxidoreductase complex cytochrome b subunit|nr:cytochrome b N-terminal domain-containing protein [Ignavibacterium sp.]
MQSSENTQKPKRFSGIILHLHPKFINERALAFNRTFGLGGMAALLIVLLFVTGILLRFYYEPFPQKAYNSIVLLQNNVLFGQLIRNIHHWCGVFLVIISFLHLLRVFFTGGFQSSRKFNWIIGLALFVFVIASNFTGYLLPWDQLAYWAITVGTSLLQYVPFIGDSIRNFILAGDEVNANTLLIFFNFHTAVFPILILLLMAYHFWRVRKAGGIILPKEVEEKKMIEVYPSLVYREFIVALALIAVILVFSVFFNAPLLAKANPDVSINPTKAPWYFAGIQELLMHFHPFVAAFLIPLAIVFALAYLPYIKLKEEHTGKWFYSEKGKDAAKFSALASALITILLVVINEFIPDFETLLPWLNSFISNGIIPLIILLVLVWYYYRFVLKKFNLDVIEAIQTMFVFVTTAFIILTIIGIFFRGVDMALTFPWNVL